MTPPRDSVLTVLAERSWNGARATVVRTTAGLHIGRQSPDLALMFHLGAPARVSCDYDGAAAERVQAEGEVDIIPAHCPRAWNDFDPTLSFNVWLSPEALDPIGHGMKLKSADQLQRPIISEQDERLFRTGMLLKTEMESTEPDTLFAESVISAMTVRLMKRFGLQDAAPHKSALSRRQLKIVMDYIQANLDGDVSLAALAGLLDLSTSHFRVLFRQTVGAPVHRHVVDLRLERAKRLLLDGKLNVAQIALEAGFCHQSHLARVMQQRLRIRPSDIARRVFAD